MKTENNVVFDPQARAELLNIFAMSAMQGSIAHAGFFDPTTAVVRANELIDALESFHTAERAKLVAAAQEFEAKQAFGVDLPQFSAADEFGADKVVSMYPNGTTVSADGPVQFAGEEPDGV